MGVVEDVRKAVQDVVAPDLRALAVRLDALQKLMEERFTAVDRLAEVREKLAEVRAMETNARLEQFNARMDQFSATMAANHESVMQALDLDRRMGRVERQAFGTEART